jgi:16S rRNA processing protein RimM
MPPAVSLPAGRVGRPHGLDGFFHVTHARPQLLAVGTPVRVGEVDTEVVARKGTDERPVIRVAIASDRTAVEALRGAQLHVAESDAPPLDDDEFWAEELEGCTVAGGERVLGTVRRLMALPSCEVLELDTGLLVPLVRDCVRAVDVEGRRIEIDEEFLGAD